MKPGKDIMKFSRALITGVALPITITGSLLLSMPVSNASPTHEFSYSQSVVQYSSYGSPSTEYYVVQGDTLSSIAAKFGTTWETLYCVNESVIGDNPDVIVPGEKLVITTKASCSKHSQGTSSTSAVPAGSPQHIAWALLSNFGNDRQNQYDCLNSIIMAESSWNINAYNPSGAYGIPQALPGSKMAGWWGSDWESSPYVQLFWMIKEYIPATYGTPCGAWSYHEAHGYY